MFFCHRAWHWRKQTLWSVVVQVSHWFWGGPPAPACVWDCEVLLCLLEDGSTSDGLKKCSSSVKCFCGNVLLTQYIMHATLLLVWVVIAKISPNYWIPQTHFNDVLFFWSWGCGMSSLITLLLSFFIYFFSLGYLSPTPDLLLAYFARLHCPSMSTLAVTPTHLCCVHQPNFESVAPATWLVRCCISLICSSCFLSKCRLGFYQH